MRSNFCLLLCTLIFCSGHSQVETAKGHYLFPELTQGVVLLKNGKADPKLLNYNCLTEQLVFDSQGRILAVPDDQMQRIDTVFIMERKFVVVNDKIMELIHDSVWDLYVEHKCTLKEEGKNAGYGGTSQTSAINSPSAVALGGNIYNMQLPKGFETKRLFFYWIMHNGDARQFVNMKQLKKLYKEKGDIFNAYVREHEITYEDHAQIIRLIQHLETN